METIICEIMVLLSEMNIKLIDLLKEGSIQARPGARILLTLNTYKQTHEVACDLISSCFHKETTTRGFALRVYEALQTSFCSIPRSQYNKSNSSSSNYSSSSCSSSSSSQIQLSYRFHVNMELECNQIDLYKWCHAKRKCPLAELQKHLSFVTLNRPNLQYVLFKYPNLKIVHDRRVIFPFTYIVGNLFYPNLLWRCFMENYQNTEAKATNPYYHLIS